MSTPTTNPSTTTTTTPPLRPLYLALALVCPLLIALPPRKLDFYTFTLSGLFVFSAQELAFGTGRRAGGTPRAGPMEAVLGRAEVDADADGKGAGMTVALPGVEAGTGPAELLRRKEGRGKGEGVVGMARDLWMGGEEAGWKERRVAEERERLEGGEGYWDLILGQVREAFGRDRSTGERVGEGGEEENWEGRS